MQGKKFRDAVREYTYALEWNPMDSKVKYIGLCLAQLEILSTFIVVGAKYWVLWWVSA